MSMYTADHRGSASDLILGGKGFVAEATYDAAWNYLRGH
jgi:hypothetical protein